MGGLVNDISNVFGGTPNNADFTASSAPIVTPTTTAQTSQALGQSQDAMSQQQSLINALQGQNGIQNQSNVYNQLQGVANGTGPNPAQAQLQQATGQNVANQAALMAGQRGAGANVGLIARQAAQTGASTQQNAVGQAATLQANQSLGALGQLGSLATQQVGQQTGAVNNLNTQAQNEQGQLLNSVAGVNTANVQNTSNQNATNENLAAANAATTAQATGGLLNGLSSALMPSMSSLAKGGPVKKMAAGGMFDFDINGSDPTAGSSGSSSGGGSSGGGGGIMSLLPLLALAYEGGKIEKNGEVTKPMAGGGMFTFDNSLPPPPASSGGSGGSGGGGGDGGDSGGAMSALGDMFSQGGKAENPKLKNVPDSDRMSMNLYPSHLKEMGQFYHGKEFKDSDVGSKMKEGGRVPGKAPVKGDSPKNDIVKAKLSPGEFVIPKSVMESDDPAAGAAKMIAQYQAKQGKNSKSDQSDFKSALKRAIMERKQHETL